MSPRVSAKFVLLLLCTVLPGLLSARSFTPLGKSSGLAARVVPSMLIDRDGYLWVGSREGLFRYDGYATTAYTPGPDEEGAITDLDIRVLAESSDGDIWVGTNTGGLNRFDRDTGRFEALRHDSSDPGSVLDDSIYGVGEGPDGGIWAATLKGVSRLDRETGQFEHFLHDPNDAGSLSHEWAYRVYLSPSNTLWIGTVGGGINRWHPERRKFTQYDLAALSGGPDGLNDVFAIQEDANGILWIGTREGLLRFDPENVNATPVSAGMTDDYAPLITDMIADESGQLWLGTMSSGVLIVDPLTGDWTTASDKPLGAEGYLPAQPQMSLAQDGSLLFVGTWGSGVFRAPLDVERFRLMNRQIADGLQNDTISAVLATAETGRPWVGSFGGGPQRVNVETMAAETTAPAGQLLGTVGVMDMLELSDSRLLAATTHGIFEIDQAGEQTGHYANDPGREESIPAGYVNALLEAGDAGVWVGVSDSGLQYFDTESGRFTAHVHDPDRADSLSGNAVTVLLRADEDHIWVGTRSNGLNLCKTSPFSCDRFPASQGAEGQLGHFHITSLRRDRRGRTWVGTDGGGLSLVERDEKGRVVGFKTWRTDDGLLSDGIMAIEEDLDESLWLSTRHGLSRLNPATGSVVNHVAESGLPASHFNANASAADGRFIYFGSVDGLLVVEKGSLLNPRRPSSVRITSVESMSRGDADRLRHAGEGRVQIPYRDIVALEMAVLDYSEGTHEYWYRLSPDEPWDELGTQRQIIFYGLAPGVHHFQARGRDTYGQIGQSRVLELEIVPPFWMRTWFRLLAAILLLALGIGVHIVRQQNLRRRANELLRLGEARERALEEQLGNQAELAVLTPRQKEVLQLIAEGYSTREMADLLDLSVKTIENHRANLMDRLEIRDVPGLVRLAIRARLVSPHD